MEYQGFYSQMQGAPDWVRDFISQKSGFQGGVWHDQSDIYQTYRPMIANAQNTYGDAFNNPHFLKRGMNDFSDYNPFFDQGASGTVMPSGVQEGFNWSYNPFTGLDGVDSNLNYLDHYWNHNKDAFKGYKSGNAGDVAHYDRMTGPGDYTDSERRFLAEVNNARAREELMRIRRMYEGY